MCFFFTILKLGIYSQYDMKNGPPKWKPGLVLDPLLWDAHDDQNLGCNPGQTWVVDKDNRDIVGIWWGYNGTCMKQQYRVCMYIYIYIITYISCGYGWRIQKICRPSGCSLHASGGCTPPGCRIRVKDAVKQRLGGSCLCVKLMHVLGIYGCSSKKFLISKLDLLFVVPKIKAGLNGITFLDQPSPCWLERECSRSSRCARVAAHICKFGIFQVTWLASESF